MASQAAQGKIMLEKSNYDEAIKAYTAALQASPTSPDYLLQRSTAFQRTKRYQEALQDAENAVIHAQSRARKELITEAQFRRGIALYCLGRYGDANFVLNLVKQRDPNHKAATLWLSKAATAMSKLGPDDAQVTVTASETPDPSAKPTPQQLTTLPDTTKGTPDTVASASIQSDVVPPQTPIAKIRHEWYQNTETIYFTLFVKGIPKDKAHIEITEHSLSIAFPLDSGATYDLTLEPLYRPVNAEKSVIRILPAKIEVNMVKKIPGLKWPKLESPDKEIEYSQVDHPKATASANGATAPSYPTSSASGPKNWDKITNDLQTVGEDGKMETDDDDGGDSANHFFKQLFKGASPDTQRAMMKSYVESNGTALSTNWEEVGKAKVETVPPEGMEAKTW